MYAVYVLRLEIGRLCHSSRRDGVICHFTVSAWIQYSRRRPPGAGWICGTSWAIAARGLRTRAAVASNSAAPSEPGGPGGGAPRATPKNDRRVEADTAESLVRPYSQCKYVRTRYDGRRGCPRRGFKACPGRDRRRGGAGRRERGRRRRHAPPT